MARYRKSVLLVDDDPAHLKLFTRYLERLGFHVLATHVADQALAEIVRGNVGCIVTDQACCLPAKNWFNWRVEFGGT